MREPRMVEVDVRCCCNPGKLLGRVIIATDMPLRAGRRFSWAVVTEPRVRLPVPRDPYVYTTISLDLAEVQLVNPPRVELAFKSNDHPIETLRKIKTWRDA